MSHEMRDSSDELLTIVYDLCLAKYGDASYANSGFKEQQRIGAEFHSFPMQPMGSYLLIIHSDQYHAHSGLRGCSLPAFTSNE